MALLEQQDAERKKQAKVKQMSELAKANFDLKSEHLEMERLENSHRMAAQNPYFPFIGQEKVEARRHEMND